VLVHGVLVKKIRYALLKIMAVITQTVQLVSLMDISKKDLFHVLQDIFVMIRSQQQSKVARLQIDGVVKLVKVNKKEVLYLLFCYLIAVFILLI
jgi:hypothetical protein